LDVQRTPGDKNTNALINAALPTASALVLALVPALVLEIVLALSFARVEAVSLAKARSLTFNAFADSLACLPRVSADKAVRSFRANLTRAADFRDGARY
jgi:hypothetical protein